MIRVTYVKKDDKWKYDKDGVVQDLPDKYKNKSVKDIEKELKKDGKET